jgi:hypothetical protein
MNKKQVMFELISSFESSGLSQAVFCEQANIGIPKFTYWRRKWLAENTQEESTFLEIQAPVFSESIPEVEVTYPNGISLKLKTADLSLIQQLVNHV